MFILKGIGMVLSTVYSVAIYAVCAYSLYTIGSRNGVKNSWLAFVPIFCNTILSAPCVRNTRFWASE